MGTAKTQVFHLNNFFFLDEYLEDQFISLILLLNSKFCWDSFWFYTKFWSD